MIFVCPTDDVNFDHLLEMVSARIFHCELNFFFSFIHIYFVGKGLCGIGILKLCKHPFLLIKVSTYSIVYVYQYGLVISYYS